MSLMLVAVFGLFQVILFLMHASIYRSLVFAFGWNDPWLAWLFGILSVTFVIASILAHKFSNFAVKWFYRISAYWFGMVQALFVASVFFYFSEAILYAANVYVPPIVIGGICFGALVLIHLYATWQTGRIKVTRINVSPAKSSVRWPESWRGKKIVFLSDLHLGAVRSEVFSRRIVEKIKTENPDIVLIGGDVFDGVKCHPLSLLEPFRSLRPPLGIYFISGNHEYIIEETETLFKEIETVGIKILRNSKVDIEGIQFAGVDWKDARRAHDFAEILEKMKLEHGKPSILMRHEPNHLDVAERAGITLTLSGHTHGGAQIFPLRVVTYRLYSGYDYGLKPLRDMMVYTSSGVGTWGPPLRFLTKTEIVAITLN